MARAPKFIYNEGRSNEFFVAHDQLIWNADFAYACERAVWREYRGMLLVGVQLGKSPSEYYIWALAPGGGLHFTFGNIARDVSAKGWRQYEWVAQRAIKDLAARMKEVAYEPRRV